MVATATKMGDAADRQGLAGHGLESAWERAWTARARAAERGDYIAAQHWHRRALALGASLAKADRAARPRQLPAWLRT